MLSSEQETYQELESLFFKNRLICRCFAATDTVSLISAGPRFVVHAKVQRGLPAAILRLLFVMSFSRPSCPSREKRNFAGSRNRELAQHSLARKRKLSEFCPRTTPYLLHFGTKLVKR
jgi:hypothetical protein